MGSRRTARSARTATATLLVALLAGCCGDDGGGDAAGEDGDDPVTTTTTTTTTTLAPAGGPGEPTCEDGTFDGRPYILCTAGGDDPGDDQPLVLALHGRGSSPDEMRSTTGLDRRAAEAGAAIVFPAGIDQGWGDDTFPTAGRPAGDEDVVHLDGLVAELQADPRIADGPVGVVGFSNGASMALRYGAQRPEAVEGIVAVAGQLPRDPAIRPTGPVPLMLVYGTGDPVRSHDTGIPDNPGRQEGDPTPTLSTPDTVAAWVAAVPGAADHHVGPEETDPSPGDGTRLRLDRWTGDDDTAVVLYSIVDGGHTWPGGPVQDPDFGPVSSDLPVTDAAVGFALGIEGE